MEMTVILALCGLRVTCVKYCVIFVVWVWVDLSVALTWDPSYFFFSSVSSLVGSLCCVPHVYARDLEG